MHTKVLFLSGKMLKSLHTHSTVYNFNGGKTIISHIAEYSRKVRVFGVHDKTDDIEVENNSSKPNDVVEVRTGKTN